MKLYLWGPVPGTSLKCIDLQTNANTSLGIKLLLHLCAISEISQREIFHRKMPELESP